MSFSARTRTHRRSARRRRPLRAPRVAVSADLVLFLAIAVIVGGVSFLYIRQATVLRTLTAECASAREDLVERQEVNYALELSIEEALSLKRISDYAVSRLGMVAPAETRYVYVPTRFRP